MKERHLPRAKPHLPEEDVVVLLEEFGEILRSGRLTRGPHLERFEQEFAAHLGVEHAIGLSSGTAPLEIALRFWQVEGREVIVPTNTFVASANAVLLAGGIPVLADISPACLSSSYAQIKARLTTERREEIIAATIQLVAQKGVKAATIRQITTEAGVTEGALYRHFTSKEDLCQQAYKRIVAEMAAAKAQLAAGPLPLRDKLREWVRLSYEYFDQYPEAFTYVLLTSHDAPVRH